MDIFSLKNKIIVVTGASGLLGKEHIEAIASYGGTPVLIDLNQKILDEQVALLNQKYKVNSIGYAVDITNEKEVKENCEQIILKYSKIDGLVNNAANNPKVENSNEVNFSRLENFPVNVWDNDLDKTKINCSECSKQLTNKNLVSNTTNWAASIRTPTKNR